MLIFVRYKKNLNRQTSVKEIPLRKCMTSKGRYISVVLCTVFVIGLLAGCRTNVSFDAVRPAEIDMSDYRTVGIFEFSDLERSRYSRGGYVMFQFYFDSPRRQVEARLASDEVIRYLTSGVVRTLDRTGYFQIIPPAQLQRYMTEFSAAAYDHRRLQQTFGVDAFIIGSVESMDRREYPRSRSETVYDSEQEKQVQVTRRYLIQEVYLEISYSVVDAHDGRILAVKRLDGRDRRETRIPEDQDEADWRAPSLLPLYRGIIDDFLPEIRDHLTPRTVRQFRSLERDRSGDPRMEAADDLVKEGLYRDALRTFTSVWYQTGNSAAGYNAAVLHEVLGEMDAAVSMMRETAESTGESRAYRELNRLLEERQDFYRAIEQIR